MGIPLAENFNEVLTVDLKELHGDRFLVMVKWTTCQATCLRSKNPENMKCLMMKGVSYFGAPKIILSDKESENLELSRESN